MTERTKDDLLDEVQRLATELDRTPTATDMNESGEYWASYYQEEFGGWNNAVREAGLEPNQPRKISNNDLLNEIRRLARKLNRTPTKKEMNELGEYYGRSYQDRFGSWSEAIRQAGLEPNQKISSFEFRKRPDKCPLCGTDSGLDFHHWRYGENKVGCYLCRDCHDAIHEGPANTQNPGWLVPCVKNLVERHVQHHNDLQDVDVILDRYNLPDIKDIVENALQKYGE